MSVESNNHIGFFSDWSLAESNTNFLLEDPLPVDFLSTNEPEKKAPSVLGYTLDEELDALHRTLETTPQDIKSTWYYWVHHLFINDKLLKKDIVARLNDMYPWYRNQARAAKSKEIEITRLLRGVDNGRNPRMGKQIIKLSDSGMIEGLNKCFEYQKNHPNIRLRVCDLSKISSISIDTFKRRLGKIVESNFKERNIKELKKLLEKVVAVTGPWKIPEWEWYFVSKPEIDLLIQQIYLDVSDDFLT